MQTPDGFISPLLSFDEGRQKMFLLPAQPSSWTGPGSAFGSNGGTPISSFWEWDPASAGWSSRDTGDLIYLYQSYLTYDGLRRRQVFANWADDTSDVETWSWTPRVQPSTNAFCPRAQARATAQPWPSTASAA